MSVENIKKREPDKSNMWEWMDHLLVTHTQVVMMSMKRLIGRVRYCCAGCGDRLLKRQSSERGELVRSGEYI